MDFWFGNVGFGLCCFWGWIGGWGLGCLVYVVRVVMKVLAGLVVIKKVHTTVHFNLEF